MKNLSFKLIITLLISINFFLHAQDHISITELKGKILEKRTNRWIGFTVSTKPINEKSWQLKHDFYYNNGTETKHLKTIESISKLEVSKKSKNSYEMEIKNNKFPLINKSKNAYFFEIMNAMDTYGQNLIEYCAEINGDEGFIIFILCAPVAGLPYLFGASLVPVDIILTASNGSFNLENRALRSFDLLNEIPREKNYIKMRPKKFNALLNYLSQ